MLIVTVALTWVTLELTLSQLRIEEGATAG
jgi:hypothetical protein